MQEKPKTPKEIVAAYLESALFWKEEYSSDPTKPGYPVQKLYDHQLKLHPTNPTLKDIPRSVLLTAFDTKNWKPTLFNNLPGSENGDAYFIDAVVASSAMPGMFGSHNGFIDGAFVNHDPTLFAVGLQKGKCEVPIYDMVVITIGTGFMPNWLKTDTSNWGASQWMNASVAPPPTDWVPPLLINLNTPAPILNACLTGTSTNMMPQLAGMVLNEGQFVYLNKELPRYIPENAWSVADLEILIQAANEVDLQPLRLLLENHWK